MAERLGDATLQIGGNFIAAPARDESAQLGLEVEPPGARGAGVEMPSDGLALE